MNSPAIQYNRLRRHSEAAAQTYDEISFLDLAHALRIWVDLQKIIGSEAPEFSKSISFRTALPSRHTKRILQDREFVYSLLTDSVTTYASKGIITGLQKQDEQPANAEVIAKCRRDGARLDVAFYAYISPGHDLRVAEIFQGPKVKRCNFQNWMNSPAVVGSLRTKDGHFKPFSLTREKLIQRVANELDGSHPKGMDVAPRAIEASRVTHYLLGHMIAGLPLPYFLLLKVSQDILRVGQKYFS